MKEKFTYKAGKKKQHNSLMSIEKFTFGDNPTISEFDELNEALKDEPKTDDEAMTLLYQFVCSVMEDKALELGIKKGTEISHKNTIEHGPVFFSGLNAIRDIQQSFDAKHQDDYKLAFTHLLHAIPALLRVQLLANEAFILAWNNHKNENLKQYQSQDAKANALKLAAELWASDTNNEYRVGEAAQMIRDQLKRDGLGSYDKECIRKWIKGDSPEYARKGGRPKNR